MFVDSVCLKLHICFAFVRQVIYELKAGGIDQRRLVGARLEKLAEGEAGRIAF